MTIYCPAYLNAHSTTQRTLSPIILVGHHTLISNLRLKRHCPDRASVQMAWQEAFATVWSVWRQATNRAWVQSATCWSLQEIVQRAEAAALCKINARERSSSTASHRLTDRRRVAKTNYDAISWDQCSNVRVTTSLSGQTSCLVLPWKGSETLIRMTGLFGTRTSFCHFRHTKHCKWLKEIPEWHT